VSSTLQHKTQCSEQNQKVEELQSRLAEDDLKILEGELLQRKLHNNILVMHHCLFFVELT